VNNVGLVSFYNPAGTEKTIQKIEEACSFAISKKLTCKIFWAVHISHRIPDDIVTFIGEIRNPFMRMDGL
tara:strand:+ start:197 stop:406 length:210 start_codon:yes stop_codon:yes gene_type:complete